MTFNNPVVKKITGYQLSDAENTATYKGVAFKALLFGGLTILSAIVAYVATIFFLSGQLLIFFAVACPIIAFVLGMVSGFAPKTTKITGTLYTIFMGLSLGFISCVFSMEYSGVVFSALIATAATFAVMTILYATGIIKVGHKFRSIMMAGLIGIVLTNLIVFVISLFTPALSLLIYGNFWLAFGISAFMCLFAAFMIIFDLQTITMVVEGGMDKQYEWSAAFGLVLTLIWLYIQFLRLFALIASRKN